MFGRRFREDFSEKNPTWEVCILQIFRACGQRKTTFPNAIGNYLKANHSLGWKFCSKTPAAHLINNLSPRRHRLTAEKLRNRQRRPRGEDVSGNKGERCETEARDANVGTVQLFKILPASNNMPARKEHSPNDRMFPWLARSQKAKSGP